jgi:hypothetical protein
MMAAEERTCETRGLLFCYSNACGSIEFVSAEWAVVSVSHAIEKSNPVEIAHVSRA